VIQELRTMLLLSSTDGSSPVASVAIPPGVCMRAMSSLVMTSSSGPVSDFPSCLRLRARLA
jgi:hypothetical protein